MRIPPVFDGLAFRIGLLLTIALVPLGLIAMSQTRKLVLEESRRSEAALLALTAEAAVGEESYMRAGLASALALASAVTLLRQRPDDCNAVFVNFVKRNSQYSFAGYVGTEGLVVCGSAGVGTDVRQGPGFQEMAQSPGPRISVGSGRVSGTRVVILSNPVFDAHGNYDGIVAVSLPNKGTFWNERPVLSERPLDLITFNDSGDVLSAQRDLDTVAARLPADRPLQSFVGQPRTTFRGETAVGEERVFAVVPVIPDQVFALGSWPAWQFHGEMATVFLSSPFLFPALMWLASLAVAYLAVHRLAIRNIADLRGRMARFAATQRFDRPAARSSAPLEFRQIEQTWADLADTVVREEAELENIIHGRTVLLKEVHHRVKNNLQLIASIVSMKVRKAATPEARAALKEVQAQVMSIATVHQALYSTSTVGRVQADELLSSIVGKMVAAGTHPSVAVDISTAFAPVSLYPDQAVPLSLLASEAVTNALKYVGQPADGSRPWIRVELRREGNDGAMLTVENSCGTPLLRPEPARGAALGTGLGTNLIEALARQLRGQLETADGQGTSWRMRVTFPIVAFDEAPQESSLSES